MTLCDAPILWVAVSVIVGELVNRHIRARDEMSKELANAREREEKNK